MVSPGVSSAPPPQRGDGAKAGFFYALTAYGLWGFLPLYFRLMEDVGVVEMLAHRILWSLPVALIVLAAMGRLGELWALTKQPRIIGMMAVTAALISVNWGIYVWAISQNITSQAALGYYINPLISVLLGVVLLGEKLSNPQKAAIVLALAGVLVRTISGGVFPWVAITLAFSFAFYGYLRKTVSVGPTPGFTVEVAVLFPIALCYVLWLHVNGQGSFTFADSTGPWLMFAGPVTAVPLILYAYGAKRLRLATLGLMQYIAPSIIFIISFTTFGEELDLSQMITFGLIWSALVLYTISVMRPATPE